MLVDAGDFMRGYYLKLTFLNEKCFIHVWKAASVVNYYWDFPPAKRQMEMTDRLRLIGRSGGCEGSPWDIFTVIAGTKLEINAQGLQFQLSWQLNYVEEN